MFHKEPALPHAGSHSTLHSISTSGYVLEQQLFSVNCESRIMWQLRVGRSSLNSHLYPIGLSNTKSCPCGFANESVEHFLLDCIFYQNIRGQLYQKLGGLLEMKLSTYSKKDLVQIMLCGEKPHLPEKFYHNKSIFFSVQTFLLKTKRLIAYNKPRPLAPPPHESD